MTRILDWAASKLVALAMRPYPLLMKITAKKLREYYDFLIKLGGWSFEDILKYDHEIKADRDFLAYISTVTYDNLGKPISINPWNWRFALYVIIRLTKPDTVVETGVEHGISTIFALKALSDDGRGRLYSIDLPDSAKLPPNKPPGWIIPENLKSRWTLKLGPSKPLLERILDEVESVDIFVHDSEHSYDNMFWEFSKVFPKLRVNGILLSDDVEENNAFHDFAASVEREALILSEWRSPRPRFAKFGGIMK